MDSNSSNFTHRTRKRYSLSRDCPIEECMKYYNEEKSYQESIVDQLVLIYKELETKGLRYAFAVHLAYNKIIKHHTHLYQFSIKNQTDRLRKSKDIELYSNIINEYADWNPYKTIEHVKGKKAKLEIDEYFKSKGY